MIALRSGQFHSFTRRLMGRPVQLLALMCLMLVLSESATAHEAWVLTHEQMIEWNAKPKPEIFTTWNATNITIYDLSILFLVGWILLHYTGAREMFPHLQIRLASYGGYASLALRIALGVMLFMAAFGLAPRHGTAYFEAATLAAPDLELRLLSGSWAWIAWIEALLAFALLFGIYVRAAAAVFIAVCLLGLYLFPYGMLAYFGIVVAAAVYLLLQGAGSLYVPMPSVPGTERIVAWLADQPRERAQWLLRLSAGICFTYIGIEYKLLQPNLMMALIELHDLPTFGFEAGTFVLFTAIVETVAGLLMIAGVLMRPLSAVLFFAFVFFSIVFKEGVLSHSIAYGILATYALNGAGHWRRPVARDKFAKIVVLGGSFPGIHCAMKLERLLGKYTNVEVTLVHRESFFQFHPLLAEVIGGTVQPGNIVNPIRRICPRTRYVHGQVKSIDPEQRRVEVLHAQGQMITFEYDQLIVALEREADFSGVPGLLEHALPIMTIGDALFLRQRVLETLEHAESAVDPDARQGGLTYCVVGAGLLGSATAAELRELINAALVSYPGIAASEPHVMLIERQAEILPRYSASVGSSARRRLEKLGVEVLTETDVVAITPEEVVLASGTRISSRTTIGSLRSVPSVIATLPGSKADGRVAVDDYLRIPECQNIRVVGDCAKLAADRPFFALREIRLGAKAAYNAWADTQGYQGRGWYERGLFAYVVPLGRRATVGRFFRVNVAGVPAWILSRLHCLLTLPGLERNLRILIDWGMDIVFRNDIVVLAPKLTQKLSRAHYEPGDVIIREGDEGSCAYFINTGEVEVVRQVGGSETRIRTQNSGECFGEIALLSNVRRTATVRCLTPVDVTVVPRDQFLALGEGYRDLVTALDARMAELQSREGG